MCVIGKAYTNLESTADPHVILWILIKLSIWNYICNTFYFHNMTHLQMEFNVQQQQNKGTFNHQELIQSWKSKKKKSWNIQSCHVESLFVTSDHTKTYNMYEHV